MNIPTSIPLPCFVGLFITIGIFRSFLGMANGAEQSSVTQLAPIIVSASALETPASQSPVNATVITRKEMKAQQAHRFSEILQQVPGLYVDEMGGRGGVTSLYLRGSDPNMTLVMIDGVPINDPTNPRGGSVDLSTLTPERIEQVEIIRGPLSARYGSEAVSGVINIITQSGEQESHQSLQLSGGRFGYTREVLQANGPIGPASYALSFSHTRNDEQVKDDRFALETVGWHLNWHDDMPVKLRLTGQFTHTASRAFPEGSGGPRFAFLRDTEKRNTYELVTGLHVNHEFTESWQQTFSINLFRRTQDNDHPGVLLTPTMFQVPPTSSDTTYTRIQPQWEHTISLTSEWSLTGGMQLTTEIGKRKGIQELTALGAPTDQHTNFRNTRSTGAFFTEMSASMYSNIHITGGIRVDIPEGFKTEVSPRIAVSYQATDATRFRAGYGEGFKLPGMASLGDPTIGNAQLQPETSRGWDVGIFQQVEDDILEIELTYFRNRFSKLIDLDPTLARMNMFRLVNLQTVKTQGLEASAHLTPVTNYSMKGFLTYLDMEIKGTSERLRNRPTWSGGIILTAQPTPTWTLRTQVRAVGNRIDLQIPTNNKTVAGYIKTDLAMTFQPTAMWRLFGVVENLTNTRYEEFLGFPAPRRSIRIGIEYTH